MATELKYVKEDKIPLEKEPRSSSDNLTYLLWGDPVHVKDTNPPDSEWVEVMARRWDRGFVRREHLMDDPILEIYVIDVGQGDGVLFKTPDNKWHMVDAGTRNSLQMTRKGAANFVRFKFIEDLRQQRVELESMILSHPDLDHFGGMIDLLNGQLGSFDPFGTTVHTFYHNGMGRFKDKPKLGEEVEDGEIEDYPFPRYRLTKSPDYIRQLLDGRQDFEDNLDNFSEDFMDLSRALLSQPDMTFQRLSADSEFLPGYGAGNTDIQIRVLGPIVETFNGTERGLRMLSGGEAITRNGHSIVLRIDYGKVRILLTGDLNRSSQQLLLNYTPEEDFRVDVAKGCHHGSADILFEFLKAMNPKATIISSGDNETFAHPQPTLVGASGFYGREYTADDGKSYPPLVYSTELARSTNLKFPSKIRTRENADDTNYVTHFASNSLIQAQGEDFYRKLLFVPMVSDLSYGLVSVRTDGERILIATSKEAGNNFDIDIIDNSEE